MTKSLIKSLSVRTLFWIIFWMAAAGAIVGVTVYWAIQMAMVKLTALEGAAELTDYQLFVTEATSWLRMAEDYHLTVIIGFFLLLALLLWGCLRVSIAMTVGREQAVPAAPTAKKKMSAASPDPAASKAVQERLFLHLLAALQREGRLVDFLSEDLTAYADDQVGAAVRNIHENCKKALAKYVKLEPVLSAEEESEITVPPDFDPDTIRLVGNVAGDPPFKGTVRHRGWMARNIEIPTLSGTRDPGVVAAAEVEL